MTLVGVTGNSGCGQTPFAGEFQRLGAGVCSLDEVGHRLLRRPQVLSRVANALEMPQLVGLEAALARRAIGSAVFASPRMLSALNSIVHPMLRRWAHLSAARLGGAESLYVLEGALLLELGLDSLLDLLVVVSDSMERASQRVARRDGIPEDQVEARWRAQWPLSSKTGRADLVVENSGGEEELRQRARALYRRLAPV